MPRTMPRRSTPCSAAPSAFRDIVVLNSAAALMVAGAARDLKRGRRDSPSRRSTAARRRTALETVWMRHLRMSDTLAEIVADKREHVAAPQARSGRWRDVRGRARRAAEPPRGFATALQGGHRRRAATA